MNKEHYDILCSGVNKWNTWREMNPAIRPSLSGADLSGVNLKGVNFSQTDLGDAKLYGALLSGADLSGAYLRGANLAETDLCDAELKGANLRCVIIGWANPTRAKNSISGADFDGAEVLKGWVLTKQEAK